LATDIMIKLLKKMLLKFVFFQI